MSDVLNLKWLPIEEYISSSLARIAFDALYKVNWPEYLSLSLAKPRSRNLRSNEIDGFKIDVSNCSDGSFNYVAGKCFNELPLNVRKVTSKLSFKSKCFDYFFEKAIARAVSLA